jgi:periplasmic protein TonB
MPGVYPGMFEQSILLAGRTSKRWTMALSAAAELAGIGVLVMLPLIHAQRLPGFGLTSIAVWLPLAKPEAPVHAVPSTTHAKPSPFVRPETIIAPPAIPEHINLINDAPPQLTGFEAFASDSARIAIGPAGFSNNTPEPPRRPVVRRPAVVAPPAATVRIKVSQMEPAKLLVKVVPVYPPMARTTRTQGTVYLLGVIATDGTIQSLHVISGHPLLVNAALDAVRQWRYKPTILNGRPVEVEAPISVTFTLQ